MSKEMKIPALSLWQPWASLVACGAKRIETRSWRCSLPPGSLLAIHAAKKWNGELAALCLREPFLSALDPRRELIFNGRVCPLPTGAVLCIVRFEGCVSTLTAAHKPHLMQGHERAFGDYGAGRFAWIFDDVLLLPNPAPVIGEPGLWQWSVPDDLCETIEAFARGEDA